MPKLFDSVADLGKSGYLFRIQDSGPSTIDRITVVMCDGDYLGLSQTGQGFSQWGSGLDPMHMAELAEEGKAVDMALGDLTPELQQHILYRINEAWQDFLDSEDAAESRDAAEVHEGTHDSGGKGIYRYRENQFRIRYDSEPSEDGSSDDPGPFDTFRDALVHTLPQEHSLSGPEYQSPLEVGSLNPTPGVAEAIAKLEDRTDFDDLETMTISELRVGDLVDLENDPYADPNGEEPGFEFELAEVVEVEQETADCVRVSFEGYDAYGFPPDHKVRGTPREKRREQPSGGWE